ncbi:MAG: peptidoglycan bridge formation glycyltransferase FemA/FemB family protein [Treponema sp.]|jgi:lipid II:glycine glycyltransferase (peptidoglycan interpeptide bridge formation enzyme)|nr:peptidoglycan bridge formation glycyltransferase FemA/FemB family protein [Treponema sp.]
MEFIKNITPTALGVCENADSFLQSAMWGRFKARFGWEARAFSVDWNPGGARPLLALSRRIAPFLSMTYVPWGPELPAAFPGDPHSRAGAAAELARALKPLLKAAFVRFDPPWFNDEGGDSQERHLLHSHRFRRAGADIQPPDTVLADLTPPPDDILAAMKPKCRYNIGLAQKRGVVVRDCGAAEKSAACEQGIEVFYRLLKETALRDGIAVHNVEYYRALFEEAKGENGKTVPAELRLYTARHENDDLAAIVTLFRGKQAVYLYGASSNIKRNLMAPYALQWKAMQDAKASGCAVYDFFGIPPDESPGHPMAGLYRFKTGFGGRIIHRPGSWDYPYKPALYAMFNCAESLRKKIMSGKRREAQ